MAEATPMVSPKQQQKQKHPSPTAILKTTDEDDNGWVFSIPLVDSDDDKVAMSLENRPQNASLREDLLVVPEELVEQFRTHGFVVVMTTKTSLGDRSFGDAHNTKKRGVLSPAACAALNQRLEEVLRGRYSRGMPPDKAPRRLKSEYQKDSLAAQQQQSPPVDVITQQFSPRDDPPDPNLSIEERRKTKTQPHQSIIGPIGFSGNHTNVRVIQVINMQKADDLFWKLATSPALGRVVAQLAGWAPQQWGVRLASDQIWAKPPGAAPLAFHRDAPYFMFDPPDVVTVWIALDDMDAELGPLQYVKGSHVWGAGRVGTASNFFQADGGIALLQSAAASAAATTTHEESSSGGSAASAAASDSKAVDGNNNTEAFDIVSMAGLPAGAMSIHNGLTWHGSGKNCSKSRPRRGLGLHFVPAHVRFTTDTIHSRLWRHYVEDAVNRKEDVSTVEVPEKDFPITWMPTQFTP